MDSTTDQPGRSCPLHYRYAPAVFKRAADWAAETLYVVGGLYGNTLALDEVLAMAAREPGECKLMFNGDFNWFNIDDAAFERVNTAVLDDAKALRGNVETELAAADDSAGCGCGYPDSVPEADVVRSNLILQALKKTARRHPLLLDRVRGLPMHAVVEIGDTRVGIVHGDAWSLAGWKFDVSALDDPLLATELAAIFADARLAGFASSHTCLPALRTYGEHWIINNGAAGMPNFRAQHFGVLSRISVRAPHSASLYGKRFGKLYVDALPIYYDTKRWLDAFCRNWPPGSPAYESYFQRNISGPAFDIAHARAR